jgi:Fe-S cluster biogenesis protein NfuA
VTSESGFQERIQRLSKLVAQFEEWPDSPVKTTGEELVHLLMDVHAQGLERILEIIFASRENGSTLIDQLGRDDQVGALLLLYSLHPDALETRVHKAVERLRSGLRKFSCVIDLLSIDEAVVRVRISRAGHSCGSSTGEIRAKVEGGLYEFAPDIASLEILGLEEPPSMGFVALESLLAPTLVSSDTKNVG